VSERSDTSEAKRKKKKTNEPAQLIIYILLYVGGVVSGIVGSTAIVYRSDSEVFKNYTTGWQSIITMAALIVGGAWTYQRFIRFREGKAKN
jgi:hypothetical protein